MLILALDSTAQVGSVALCEDEKLIAEYTLNTGHTHSETLLPMVESVLKIAGYTVDDVDLFVCTAGPGSFTGVRIGAATIKGLAFASKKACIGVSTLEALAYNLRSHKGIICPVMNARRSQVYTAVFRSDGETVTRIMPDSAMAISELDVLLAEYGEDVALVGDGYEITKEGARKTSFCETPERLRHQSAFSVAEVALKQYRQGNCNGDTELCVDYLRPSQAERERAEREQAEAAKNQI